MEITPLRVPDSFLIVPRQLRDERGCFYESFSYEALAAVGHPRPLAQVNYSVSRRGVVRGIHGVLLPPGQAKVVSCPRGAVRDFVVDLRLGSPTFGRYDTTCLDAESGRSVYIAEGLGHGFVALTDDTLVSYLCSSGYVPGTQLDINPFDSSLALPWDVAGEPIVSAKDAAAPTVEEATRAGLLATYEECQELYEQFAREDRSASNGSPTAPPTIGPSAAAAP
ncbi:dTDP-4-dehydrorhamnose 3,5-epimerase [Streptomyces griseochromogenes]|uniref:dTDP-4-dehydrorhamnose 3,5-epimerase n=1 Tax=Streptomyces griseochromogenes TaxID=68214 RepID=A0A1B1BB34_9ACTN|nr:dTDP-4-dehydrorhamnose 3,5-epimerase [Streptomyces griseochromogenes]ANP56030.1 dTDP-4-dehydrorhamnose 3,5-epimerase [Streptomyces griseochromogenes]MBP2051119.1 dTDP-4-dehydrorhamnose 3,5-epimerase [Streptomyces griseochromogenes]